jgi:hypothetical protein
MSFTELRRALGPAPGPLNDQLLSEAVAAGIAENQADKCSLAQKSTTVSGNAWFCGCRLGDLEVQHIGQTPCAPAEAPWFGCSGWP